MPKCLDCGNTKTFYYKEINTSVGVYDEDGTLDDVIDNWYEDVDWGKCFVCKKENIEGKL